MDNLLHGAAPLELYVWLEPEESLPGWDFQTGGPHAEPRTVFPSGTNPQLVHNYFAEYNLEFFRQRSFERYPSRLHAQFLFATRTDAENYRQKHPGRVFGKQLTRVTTRGPYTCSYHDANWIDYLHLPHSLDLDTLGAISKAYWAGTLVEEAGLTFMDQPWQEPPVIEALFQGHLVPEPAPARAIGLLPGFETALLRN
ncbi:hypothetical protein AZSI13_13370 [Azospira sp. I13]|uniref:hypothetical protein n=1 Tax=Azospira sp. I13 TaxID=1765050 RepID=UPI000D45A86C|nr:hypothetical protein [Azospira sp. I13]GBG02010.1 hypothetical protein AZSI13_13370 [Azospira sp. I13]